MKKVNIALFICLSICGIEKLSATAYSPHDTFQVRAFASSAAGSPGRDLSMRKPTAVFAHSAMGSLAELKRSIADSTGSNVGDTYYVNKSDGKKTLLKSETSYQKNILPKLMKQEGSIEFKPQ